jgi:hypothetical protein
MSRRVVLWFGLPGAQFSEAELEEVTMPDLKVTQSLRPLAAVALLFSMSASCKSPTEPSRNLFAIGACNAVFHVQIDDATVAQQAVDLVGKGNVKIICGTVRAGDGGFNAPWPWHLDPASIRFTDVVAEILDRCPQSAEVWIGDDHPYICPTSTVVLRRE